MTNLPQRSICTNCCHPILQFLLIPFSASSLLFAYFWFGFQAEAILFNPVQFSNAGCPIQINSIPITDDSDSVRSNHFNTINFDSCASLHFAFPLHWAQRSRWYQRSSLRKDLQSALRPTRRRELQRPLQGPRGLQGSLRKLPLASKLWARAMILRDTTAAWHKFRTWYLYLACWVTSGLFFTPLLKGICTCEHVNTALHKLFN